MSKQTAWLELFTGVVIDVPNDEAEAQKKTQKVKESAAALAGAEAAYALKKQAQIAALVVARNEFDKIKVDTQKVLSAPIDSGPFKGKSFLDVQNGQIDEIDTHDITAKARKTGKPPLPEGISQKMQKSGGEIIAIGIRLREKMFDPGDGSEPVPLFTPAELQAEFYTPVNRERIFPEGFIANPFSATQQMLDETNALYQEMVERKRLAGELTPDLDLVKIGIESGAKLLAAGSSMLGGLNAEGVETAKMILETGSDVLTGMAEVRGQIKEGKFADAASAALDIAGTLTGAALAAAGVDSTVCKITTGAIGTGSSAVLLGKVLNQVRNGEADISQALVQMGDVLGKGLATGAEGASGGTAKALQIAAKAAPAIFLAVGKGSELPQKVRDGDYKGVIDTLTEITKAVLDQIPGLDKVGGTVSPQELAQLGADALNLTIKTVFAVKKGEYLGALNGAITDIGASLGTVLSAAGVNETLSGQIVKLYKGAASAPKALELLRQDPPKVDEAIKELAGGIQSALSGTGNDVLTTVGESLALGIKSLVTVDQMRKLYKENDFDGAVDLFAENLSEGFDTLANALGIDIPDDEEEDDGGDEGQDKDDGGKPRAKREAPAPNEGAVAELKKVAAKLKDLQVDPKLVEEATALLQKKQDAEQELADIAEAEEILAQVQAEENALSEAELAGAEASNIEQLINDLLRERMVLKLATQIATGGASFLAQFLPGLGAASAGIKLAAALYAAGQRAKQLDAWMKSQKDLQNAQSALSSSAANFVKNQGQQLAHYSAQAFFAATQLAGEIAKLAGPASGAGAIISAAAAAGAKIEEIVMDAKNSYDVEAGWKATQKALQNPGNRRLGLEARRLNPTLAKYSMAWGAVVLKDPLARGAMKACGLTEAALKSADESEGAHLVVKYLETFYEDDVSIYRDSNVEPPKWVPAEIEISLVCWASFRRGAQSVTLTLAKAGLVEGLLGEYDSVQSQAEETGATLQTQQQALTIATQALKVSTELALKITGVDAPQLPVLPDTTALVGAIDAHTESLRIRSETAQRLYFALLDVEAGAADPQKAKANIDAAKIALKSFQSKANRVNEAAAQDAEGLKEAKLQIQTRVASMSLELETAKTKLKESQGKKTTKPEPETVTN